MYIYLIVSTNELETLGFGEGELWIKYVPILTNPCLVLASVVPPSTEQNQPNPRHLLSSKDGRLEMRFREIEYFLDPDPIAAKIMVEVDAMELECPENCLEALRDEGFTPDDGGAGSRKLRELEKSLGIPQGS